MFAVPSGVRARAAATTAALAVGRAPRAADGAQHGRPVARVAGRAERPRRAGHEGGRDRRAAARRRRRCAAGGAGARTAAAAATARPPATPRGRDQPGGRDGGRRAAISP